MSEYGALLRAQRRARRISQLELSLLAEVSARHVAFLETGRARPSRAMALRLARALQAPLLERNRMLAAAGFAPEYPSRPLDDPHLAPVRAAMRRLLERQEPYPALILDQRWTVLEANRAAARLFAPLMAFEGRNLLAFLIETPAFRDQIENWREIAPELLARLRAERVGAPPDAEIERLTSRLEELARAAGGDAAPPSDAPFLSPRFRVGDRVLSMFSTIARFGAPREVALCDLQIELFFPSDEETDAFLKEAARQAGAQA